MKEKLFHLPEGVTLPAVEMQDPSVTGRIPGGWNDITNHRFIAGSPERLTTISARLGDQPITAIRECDLVAAYAKALEFQSRYNEAVEELRKLVLTFRLSVLE